MSEPSDHEKNELNNIRRRKLESIGVDTHGNWDAVWTAFKADLSDSDADARLAGRAGHVFSEVFQFELDSMANPTTRPKIGTAALSAVIDRAHGASLCGLAISGGGIRSATFNLGVLQGLAKLRLLRRFDYLSTVSGGGYIGGWLSKWIKEEGGVESVEKRLGRAVDESRPACEPAEVQFLRRYSNYLTPALGMFSADTWAVVCTYIRNTALNMTILFAWLAAMFLLPRLLAPLAGVLGEYKMLTALAAGLTFLLTVAAIAYNISLKGSFANENAQTQKTVLLRICMPLMIAAFLGSIAMANYHGALVGKRTEAPFYALDSWELLLPGIAYFCFWVAGWFRAQLSNQRRAAAEAGRPTGWWANAKAACTSSSGGIKLWHEGLGHLTCAAGALAIGTLLLINLLALQKTAESTSWSSIQLATFGMPQLLVVFGITMTLMIGLIGRMYSDQSREWWSRQAAWTTIMTTGWLLLFVSTFYLPPLLHWAFDQYTAAASIGAALTSVLTFLGLKSGSSKATGKFGAPLRLELVAQVAPYAFTILIIGALSASLQWAVAQPGPVPFEAVTVNGVAKLAPAEPGKYLAAYVGAEGSSHRVKTSSVAWAFALCLAAAALLSVRVDVNKFSLYMMYRLRLVRAYFGASNRNRRPHPFTGFDPNDDPPLASLTQSGKLEDNPQRPYHLLNAALNLVNGEELAWQRRKAANFCYSPGFCGFEMPAISSAGESSCPRPQQGAFRPTACYAACSFGSDDDAGVKLGMAVAVSGAAASPNMGYHSSPPLAFLMTLFNLRLGRWSPNPMREHKWERSAPYIGLGSILSELFGLTGANSNFLYLSDGGHFENLGIYELVRRRCRLIVAIDASSDGGQSFDDLGNAIRKCATDLNIPVLLNARNIRTAGVDLPEGASCVTGTIKYSHADSALKEGKPYPDGVLLYIKPTIEGVENADIFNYAKTHNQFPHESTADQWFDEDQFESYRALGYQICERALGGAAGQVTVGDTAPNKEYVEALCAVLTQLQAGAHDSNVLPFAAANPHRTDKEEA